MNTPPFSELGLPDPLLRAVEDLGFEEPSAIQGAAIPPALAGEDIVGLSQTGSGKTAAFTLPVLARIDPDLNKPQALIVCPTRELANQVCDEVHRLAKHLPEIHAVPVYGGAPIDRQFRALRRGAHIVVGTPGRLLDHLRRKSFDPSRIRTAILDEADRMLDMGFRDEMEELLAALPEERQNLFFSATMNRNVERLIKRFAQGARTIEIERPTLTVEAIEQVSYEVRNRSRIELLSRLLDMDQPRLAIVFCNTKRSVDEVTEVLLARGYAADRLHGDITQALRERTLSRFRAGTVEILVATDVAARGIDVDDIDVVINYELPHDPEDYVHRIGRTGRAGRKGRAVTFVYGRDIYRLQNVERYTRQRIPRARIPSLEEVEGKLADQLFDTLRDKLEAGEFSDATDQLDRLLDQGHTATDIASALLSMLHDTQSRQGEEIHEDRPDKPSRRKREPRDRDFEAGAPRGRSQRGPRETGETEQGMTRLFLNVGKMHRLRPGDIAGLLYNEGQLPQGAVGRIHMFPKYSLVEVRSEVASEAVALSGRSRLRGKSFRLDYDRASGA